MREYSRYVENIKFIRNSSDLVRENGIEISRSKVKKFSQLMKINTKIERNEGIHTNKQRKKEKGT